MGTTLARALGKRIFLNGAAGFSACFRTCRGCPGVPGAIHRACMQQNGWFIVHLHNEGWIFGSQPLVRRVSLYNCQRQRNIRILYVGSVRTISHINELARRFAAHFRTPHPRELHFAGLDQALPTHRLPTTRRTSCGRDAKLASLVSLTLREIPEHSSSPSGRPRLRSKYTPRMVQAREQGVT